MEDARGTLFYGFSWIIDEVKPKVFIYENVRGLYTHDKGNTKRGVRSIFQKLGYTFYGRILDSKEYGIPQTRRRLFVVGFKNQIYDF